MTENKYKCPCCRHFTILEQGSFEICSVCGWEDDGQGDNTADEVWGGPNGDYSLSEARENFKKYGTMLRKSDPKFPV
jgi:hypothetical protein